MVRGLQTGPPSSTDDPRCGRCQCNRLVTNGSSASEPQRQNAINTGDKEKREVQATPRRRLLDRLFLRLLLYEESASSVDAPLDPPRKEDEPPTTRRVYGIVSAYEHAGEDMDEFELGDEAATFAVPDHASKPAEEEDFATRRWTAPFDGVAICAEILGRGHNADRSQGTRSSETS